MKQFVIILMSIPALYALDNGLALTPPMGWMQWERYRCIVDCEAYPEDCISEKLFHNVADVMVSQGYKDLGYEYIMIDDCWAELTRDENNKLRPDKKRFPSGIKNLADYIHSKGLKFGIYGDYGTKTCAGYPGSFDYLELDANTFAEWGVDYLKFDGCNIPDSVNIEDGYRNMSRYLNATKRPIAFSCSWPAYKGLESNYTRAAEDCNLWRNYGDIQDSWDSVKDIIAWFGTNQHRFASIAGPGHWNDPDMLIVGDFGLSYTEAQVQMAIWSILAAPLIMSVDLKAIQPEFKNILQNKDAIEINQDPLGIQGRLIIEKLNSIDKVNVWTRQLSPVNGNSSYAIAIVNEEDDGYPRRVHFKLSDFGLTHPAGYNVKDIFKTANFGEETRWNITEVIYLKVDPSGVVFLKATPAVA